MFFVTENSLFGLPATRIFRATIRAHVREAGKNNIFPPKELQQQTERYLHFLMLGTTVFFLESKAEKKNIQ